MGLGFRMSTNSCLEAYERQLQSLPNVYFKAGLIRYVVNMCIPQLPHGIFDDLLIGFSSSLHSRPKLLAQQTLRLYQNCESNGRVSWQT